jgi:hypothetical protein
MLMCVSLPANYIDTFHSGSGIRRAVCFFVVCDGDGNPADLKKKYSCHVLIGTLFLYLYIKLSKNQRI